MRTAYKCRAYPSHEQASALNRTFGCVRVAWNRSACGHLLKELSLSTRAWHCPSCGTRHDRDVNAAKNILAAGLAVSACGADVRHPGTPGVRSAVKQEPGRATAGIPSFRAGSSQVVAIPST